jgi:hypothetical protein
LVGAALEPALRCSVDELRGAGHCPAVRERGPVSGCAPASLRLVRSQKVTGT